MKEKLTLVSSADLNNKVLAMTARKPKCSICGLKTWFFVCPRCGHDDSIELPDDEKLTTLRIVKSADRLDNNILGVILKSWNKDQAEAYVKELEIYYGFPCVIEIDGVTE